MKIEIGTELQHINGHKYTCRDIQTGLLPVGGKTYHFVPEGRPSLNIANQGPVIVTDKTIKTYFVTKDIEPTII